MHAGVWNNDLDTATLRNDRGRFVDDVSWGTDTPLTGYRQR